jgi:VWFA-related protein
MRRTVLALLCSAVLLAQQPGDIPVFKSDTNLVVITVFAKDKDGRPVRGLTKEDFTVLENGKPQSISVFEFQNLDDPDAVRADRAVVAAPGTDAPGAPAATTPAPDSPLKYRDRRLIILYFDWSSLAEADQVRALDAGKEFVRKQMTPADLVSIATFGSVMKIEEEFTGDKDRLIARLGKIQPGAFSELSADAATEEITDQDSAFQADMTEFNIFNTDRKLGALEDLASKLRNLPEKKSIIFFSSGVSRTGMENESQLRSAINAAVRANVSFYPVDVRGLQSAPPGGDASQAAARGTGLYSGQAQSQARSSRNDSQDTLYALASDTGGKATFDTNDLTLAARQAQRDMQSYYVLGYYSPDAHKDGSFRRVEVKLANKRAASLDYRRGYFAPKDYRAFNADDKERQLEEAMQSGDPITDVPVAIEIDWMRIGKGRYFVPVSVKIPGYAIPLKKKGSSEVTSADFMAQIRDSKGVAVTAVRDSIEIKLRENKAGMLAARSLLYDTGFTLGPGKYTLKAMVRENQTGTIGTFQTKFEVPELESSIDRLALSSMVLSTQRAKVGEEVGRAEKSGKKVEKHPLVRNGERIVPSVTRVFQRDQTLTVYAEAYGLEAPFLQATVGFYRDGKKVFEARPAFVREALAGRPGAAAIQLDVPLKSLSPGEYTAQLTVIDSPNSRFAFSRLPLVISAPPAPPVMAPTPAPKPATN